MNRKRALIAITEHADDIRSFGVARVYLFGSTARGTAGSGGDVDVFVDLKRRAKFSLFDLMELRAYLSRILKVRADVFLRQGLHRVIRRDIEREALRVF